MLAPSARIGEHLSTYEANTPSLRRSVTFVVMDSTTGCAGELASPRSVRQKAALASERTDRG